MSVLRLAWLPSVVASTILSLSAANAWAQVRFAPPQNYAVSGDLSFVALADLNGDGKLDVIVANQDGGVGVLLGNGDGTLQPVVIYDATLSSSGLAVADFNHDGKLDIALASTTAGFDLLLGRGDGTFRSPVHYAGGERVRAVVAADFNGDGHIDVALADQGMPPDCGGIDVFLNNGDGTFAAPVVAATECGPVGIAAGDFNEDGKMDLAITNVGVTAVGFMLGNGDGTLQPYQLLSFTSFPIGVIAVDLNGDGHLDIVCANSGSLNVSLFGGHGDGTFTDLGSLNTGFNAHSVAAADFGNHRIDLAAPNDGFGGFPNNVSVMMHGSRGFLPQKKFATGLYPYWIATGDLNGDGKVDIVTANEEGGVSVLLNVSH
jgi:hypothetical protein